MADRLLLLKSSQQTRTQAARLGFLCALGALGATGLGSCAQPEAPLGAGRNVLLITLDTTRADHLSCLGGDPRNTPRIDGLAERSTLFTNAASESNVTNPSHLSIMSGLPAIEHGVISNTVLLPRDVDTLAEGLQREGYGTAAFIGVNHLRSLGWRSFDELPEVDGILDGEEVTDRALAWLDQRARDKPFFVWVHYFDSHILYTPPEALGQEFYPGNPRSGKAALVTDNEYFESERNPALLRWLAGVRDVQYPRAMYAATLNHVDTQVGRLLDRLALQGIEDETIIVLTADHGETLDEHGLFYTHGALYEEDLRIPLVFHIPGAPPRRSEAFVSTIDIAPTLEEAMGFQLNRAFGGLSLLPEVLPGGAAPGRTALGRRTHFVHQQAHNHSVAVRQGDWKLWWPITDEGSAIAGGPQLFNLALDPEEARNLFPGDPERAAALQELLEPWIDLQGVEKGALMKRSPAQREQLRELGYAGDDGDD